MRSTRRLRIAFVADTVHSASGGGIVSAEQFVAALRAEHDVVTVSADGDAPLPALRLPAKAMEQMHFVMARPDRAALARAFAQVDLVHLQFPFWLSFVALDQARQMGLPVVAGFHVQPENVLRNVGLHAGWLNEALYRLLVGRLYDRVDGVICPSEFARDKLVSHGLHVPTFVVSNGVSPDVEAFLGEGTRALRSPGNARLLTVLAVGRLAAEKRQDVIIDAVRLSRHRDRIRLVLAGRGPREAELRAQAAALPNGAEIGFLPRETLLGEMIAADVFAHASEVELEGMAVLEAMRAGLPTLVADAPESAASGLALGPEFLFPAGDAKALAERLDALLDSPLRMQSAARRQVQRARAYHFDRSVQVLVAAYRSVLDARASANGEVDRRQFDAHLSPI
jgi:1,2-diacylglycerol 3-alpha-glucosyltransferase